MKHRSGHQIGKQRLSQYGRRCLFPVFLLLAQLAQAQDDRSGATDAVRPAAQESPLREQTLQAAPAAVNPLTTASSSPVATLAASAVSVVDYSMPAGVCPVITDYLYQQCQQNPADAMCAPAATPE